MDQNSASLQSSKHQQPLSAKRTVLQYKREPSRMVKMPQTPNYKTDRRLQAKFHFWQPFESSLYSFWRHSNGLCLVTLIVHDRLLCRGLYRRWIAGLRSCPSSNLSSPCLCIWRWTLLYDASETSHNTSLTCIFHTVRTRGCSTCILHLKRVELFATKLINLDHIQPEKRQIESASQVSLYAQYSTWWCLMCWCYRTYQIHTFIQECNVHRHDSSETPRYDS